MAENTSVETAENRAGKIDMFPLLSGRCDSIEICEELTPEDMPELGITFQGPVKLCGSVTNSSGYIRLHMNAEVRYDTECARCLRPVSGVQSVTIDKTVAEKGVLEDEDSDLVTDDYLLIEDGMLDVASPFSEQLMLVLPARTLCREDCAGLCPRCGSDLNEGQCSCELHEPDPRLACLASLLERDTDGDGGPSEETETN